MKILLVIVSACCLVLSSARSEEFFATAQEALILGELALKQNGIDPDQLILFRMKIRPALPNDNLRQGVFKRIAEQMAGRDAWILTYQWKDVFTPLLTYGESHTVVLLSKTEAAVLVTQPHEEPAEAESIEAP